VRLSRALFVSTPLKRLRYLAKSAGKKLVPVPDNIVADVVRASIKEDSSTSKFVEAALKHAVQMNSIGISSKKLLDTCEVTRAYRVLGGSFVPMDVLNYLTQKAYAQDKPAFLAKWYESGIWYGKFLKEKFVDPVKFIDGVMHGIGYRTEKIDYIKGIAAVEFKK
jgi:hypothetical protein